MLVDKEAKLKLAVKAVNSSAWLEFEKWLEIELKESYERISNLVDIQELYRAQGHIKCLKQLFALKEHTNQSMKVYNGRKDR